ncbi:hypothetical protein CTAYLR_008332 [Chrysophaeum taylorii]|uniref:Cationic amino acid transporter C-terminal domain-containing protein n=1 Tax=Chrysophaeum taylorii TaxID=2483200 RepID=A0AAD7UEK0_9STRA|nr:hypothetical protein CTAYLR_008332 [Chrysophaeum taylorii]
MLYRRKTLAEFEAEQVTINKEHESDDTRLTLFDLLCIGIGGTVGSGVFVLTGSVFPVAGPSSAVCWMVGGLVCLLSASSYMELSVRVPTRGSTYSYSYYALGELAAVAGATSLTLEYGLSGAGVARSWSSKFASLIGARTALFASYSGGTPNSGSQDNYLDVGAALVQASCVVVVAGGLSLSKRVINLMTISKVMLVLFLIVAGFAGTRRNVFASPSTFFPDGAGGVTKGTSLLFFGFIGFDEVCCMAARCRRPKYAMPRAIIGTLLGAAALSTLAQLALSGLVDDDDDDDDGTSFEREFRLKGWKWAKYITQIGEVVLLPLVVLLSFLPQPELMAALGSDGLVSSRFSRLSGRNNDVYMFGCVACGIALTTVSLVVPFDVLWNMINLGVLLGFNLSNCSLISARLGNGGACVDPKAAMTLARFAGLYAPAAAYVLWKGCLLSVVEGHGLRGPLNLSALVVGLALFGAGFVALASIAATLRGNLNKSSRVSSSRDGTLSDAVDAPLEDDAFRAPGVPWVPGAAVFLNFLLMAQYAWIDHAYLLALYGAAYLAYFSAKRSSKSKGNTLDDPLLLTTTTTTTTED